MRCTYKPLQRPSELSKPGDTVSFPHHFEARWQSPHERAVASSHELPHIYGLLRKQMIKGINA